MLSSMTLAKFVIRIAVSAYKGVKDILRIRVRVRNRIGRRMGPPPKFMEPEVGVVIRY